MICERTSDSNGFDKGENGTCFVQSTIHCNSNRLKWGKRGKGSAQAGRIGKLSGAPERSPPGVWPGEHRSLGLLVCEPQMSGPVLNETSPMLYIIML